MHGFDGLTESDVTLAGYTRKATMNCLDIVPSKLKDSTMAGVRKDPAAIETLRKRRKLEAAILVTAPQGPLQSVLEDDARYPAADVEGQSVLSLLKY